MWTFGLIAAGLGLVTAFLVVRPLFQGRGSVPGRDAKDAEIFRDQLAELDRDVAKGVISEAEAEGARVEISRRLLKAAGAAEARPEIGPAPQGASGLVAGLALIGTPVLAGLLYLGLGSPGTPDQPLADRPALQAAIDRPSQAEMEAQMAGQIPPGLEADPEYAALVEKLEETLKDRPDDIRGLELYANALMRIERWAEAWRVQEKLIALKGGEATAELYANQAEAMVLAAGGYVSPETEQVLASALRLDPNSYIARYYTGLSLAQNGRVGEAVALWERLRADSPPDAPWLDWLDMMLAEAKGMQAAPPAGGPTQEDIAAAEQMTPEERMAMVEGMVQRLEDRLTSEGGSVDDWGRLVSSYATLNRPEEAKRVYHLALAALDEGPGKDALRRHAGDLGIEPNPPAAPPPLPGPSAGDVAAAGEMSADDRNAMIEGMVQRLQDRLTSEGGTAEEWGRLLTSYATLNRPDEAKRAYEMALAALDDEPDKDALRRHAAGLGLEDAPPATPGPTAADVAAAQEMSAEDRAAMIEGMVQRLEDRLTAEGGEAEEWLRLINAYVQLDRKDEAARVYAMATDALSDNISRGFLKEQTLLLGVPVE